MNFWLPIFLIIKKNDYLLYSNDKYIPFFNKEVIDLLQRSPKSFTIKGFSIGGIQLEVFNKYREAISLNREEKIESKSFIETIKPFIIFYKSLNEYSQQTRELSPITLDFRNIVKNATDPQKTFFIDLPTKLGFNEKTLLEDRQALNTFISVINESISELRNVYTNLIERVENSILSSLNITSLSFPDYLNIINRKYQNIKRNILPTKLLQFYERLVSKHNIKQHWIEAICYIFINKPLDNIVDQEVEYVIDSIIKMINALDDYIDFDVDDSNAFKIHITSASEGYKDKQILLSNTNSQLIEELTNKIEKSLGNDEKLNIAALATILSKKL